jgi:hypothetical protein
MAPSATIVQENTPPIRVKADAVGQVDTSKKRNFFEDVHFLGDKEGKVVIRSPPKFETLEESRTYQKQHLAAAFRVFAKQGFDEGVAGHISLRDPVNTGTKSQWRNIKVAELTMDRALLD